MSTVNAALSVVLVYPALLGTYGDSGNALILKKRAEFQGVKSEIISVASDEKLPKQGDIYLLGGGEDGPQNYARDLLGNDGGLQSAVSRGAVVFAVCAGFQIIGNYYVDSKGESQRGLGLVEAKTTRLPKKRAVGEVASKPLIPIGQEFLSGFENHGSGTELSGDTLPLGQVVSGVGNMDGGVYEGAVKGKVICTYMHGPALARNPALADFLLHEATGLKPLGPHPIDDMQRQLLAERLSKVVKS